MRNVIISATMDEAKHYAESQRWTQWEFINTADKAKGIVGDNIHLVGNFTINPAYNVVKSTLINSAKTTEKDLVSQFISVQEAAAGNVASSPAPAGSSTSGKSSFQPFTAAKVSSDATVLETSKFKITRGKKDGRGDS